VLPSTQRKFCLLKVLFAASPPQQQDLGTVTERPRSPCPPKIRVAKANAIRHGAPDNAAKSSDPTSAFHRTLGEILAAGELPCTSRAIRALAIRALIASSCRQQVMHFLGTPKAICGFWTPAQWASLTRTGETFTDSDFDPDLVDKSQKRAARGRECDHVFAIKSAAPGAVGNIHNMPTIPDSAHPRMRNASSMMIDDRREAGKFLLVQLQIRHKFNSRTAAQPIGERLCSNGL